MTWGRTDARRARPWRRVATSVGAWALLWTLAPTQLACVSVDTLGAPDMIRALWDPTTQTLPKPTDLVRDEALGRLDLPIDPTLPAAEQELRAYLNSLDGYPRSTPITLPISDAIDPQSLADNVALWTRDGDAVPLRATFDRERLLIQLVPDWDLGAELAPGMTYTYALRGYGGVRGLNGATVVSDAAFSFLKSDDPLTNHPTAFPGTSRAEQLAAATDLEAVRQKLQPAFLRAESQGWPRADIAVLGSFTTSNLPAIWFDSTSKRVPFPNNLLLNRATNTVDVPIDADDTAEAAHIKEELATYDGFSTSGRLVVRTTHPIEPTSVDLPGAVRLFAVRQGGSVQEHTDLVRGIAEDGLSMWVKPRLSLDDATTYVYAVTGLLTTTAGKSYSAQVLGALLRLSAPLSANGKAQVLSLSDADAEKLEPARLETQAVLAALANEGVAPSTLAAVVPFRTVGSRAHLTALRAQLDQQNLSTTLGNLDNQTPWDRGLFAAMPFVETIITGKMPIADHLDPYTTAFRPEGAFVEGQTQFILTIPSDAETGKPLPVVLFGHGLMTSRELVYLIADKLARSGYATFAIDLPLHGSRAVCRGDWECSFGSACGGDGVCRADNGSVTGMLTIESPFDELPILPQVHYPVTSGQWFIDPNDIVATRDHFVQAALDLCQALRVLRQNDWSGPTGGYVLNPDDIVYLGMSLGGILGGVLSGIEPRLHTLALNVPGGDFVKMMRDSTFFEPMILGALADRGIVDGSPAYAEFEGAARWLMDVIDPLSVGWHGVVEGKRVLVQMSEGDLVVPNSSTTALAERLGVPRHDYSPLVSNHAFFFDPTSFEGGDARDQVVEFFDAR